MIKRSFLAVSMLIAVIAALAAPAGALGGPNTVTRSCGHNNVASWIDSGSNHVGAYTQKVDGTCSGWLGAGGIADNGGYGTMYFNQSTTWIAILESWHGIGGIHTGCGDCNVTTS